MEPESYTADGTMFVDPDHLDWQTKPVVPVDACNHQDTICGQCVDSWSNDWEIDTTDAIDVMLRRTS